ncbi:MAG: HU family DNA-binding protein [Parabacteroides sp.]|nr:HU family DNA-binding protein [Parabacteroides sp.]
MTGEAVTLQPRISVKFRPGKLLLDTLNKHG